MDFRDEWFKLFLEELRKSGEKIDKVRDDMYERVDSLDDKLMSKLNDSSKQHIKLLSAQQDLNREHHRMNDILQDQKESLEEHIRRTNLLEENARTLRRDLTDVAESVKPVVAEFNENAIIEKRSKRTISKTTKVLGAISAGIAVVTGILKLLGYF